MITKAGDRLIPPRVTIRVSQARQLYRQNRTVTMNKDTPTSRKGGVYELLGSEAMVHRSVQIVVMTCHPNLGNKRIKFCSSESWTSRTRYSKDPGKRGRTEKDSLTSRIQTLCGTAQRDKLRGLHESFCGKMHTCVKCQAP